MAITLALEKLYTDVEILLRPVPQAFGWREPARHGENTRIAWVPGDESGSLGECGGARYPGRVKRPIANLEELFTVSLFAQDPADPESELAQYKAARLLYDQWLGAVYRSAHGTFSIVSQRWATEHKERRFGACIVVVASIDAMVPDLGDVSYPPTATRLGADIEATELGVEELVEIDPPSTPVPPEFPDP